MRLADFILRDSEAILAEWEAFASTRTPAAESMTPLQLRNHAGHILKAIAKDLMSPQTETEEIAKSHGEVLPLPNAPETAAQTHGLLRAKSGFDIAQMASEYRALRSSVLRLWFRACEGETPDIGDIVRFNEAVDQALAESIAYFSERVNRSRNLFLGMLGHDMRTPLQGVAMTAAYLERLQPSGPVADAARRLKRCGLRLQELLDDLADFNRVSLGVGITVKRRPCDLGVLVREEVEQLRTANPSRRIDLRVDGDTDGAWDGAGLLRMLDNLVGNALKYGTQGAPVTVTVRGAPHDVVVDVHNEGPAIDERLLEGLFDPLKRGLHQDESDRGSAGLGLGLYISREVVRAHGGEITVRSTAEETVFSARVARAGQAG